MRNLSSLGFSVKKRLENQLKSLVIPKLLECYPPPPTALTKKNGFSVIMNLNTRKISLLNLEEFSAERLRPADLPEGKEVYAPPTVKGKAPYIAEVKDALLIGDSPVALTSDMKLILDSIDYNNIDGRVETTLKKGLSLKEMIFMLHKGYRTSQLKKARRIECAMLLTSRWRHYGHWVPEHLLKLRSLEEFEKKTGVKPLLVMENNIPFWKITMLEKLGYPKNRIVRKGSTPVIVSRLISPSYPEPNYEDFTWLRNKILKQNKQNQADRPQRIYLSRAKCDQRRVQNEDEILPVLEEFGIKRIFPEELSIFEQAELFAGAKAIIGPHGSAFTNIFYSEQAQVMEFFGNHIPLAFYRLSLVMGHTYQAFYGKAVDPKGENRSDLIINPQELRESLDCFIEKNQYPLKT